MTRFSAVFVALVSVLSVATASPVSQAEDLVKRAETGRATWFNVGLGACGNTDSDSDPVVAISGAIYAGGSHCNKQLTIKNKANGKSATGQVRDMCPGCGAGDIDLSPSLFQKLGDLDTGVLQVEWSFN